MRKTVATLALIAVLAAGVVGAASSATAAPTKKKSCSTCHKTAAAVKVTVTRVASLDTSDTATYKIKVTGGKGIAAWAVLQGTTNVAHKTSKTGTVTLTKGQTYKVWAVKKGSGSKSKTIAVQ